MKVEYSPESDAMYIRMNDNIIVSTKIITDSVVLDIGEHGELVGIELLDASKFIDDLSLIDYENPVKFTMPDAETLAKRREATAKARRAKNTKKEEA